MAETLGDGIEMWAKLWQSNFVNLIANLFVENFFEVLYNLKCTTACFEKVNNNRRRLDAFFV